MKRLTQFLNEYVELDFTPRSYSFLKNATKLVTFNLKTSDFETLDNKAEIQHLFRSRYFPNFDWKKYTIRGNIDKYGKNLKKSIDALRKQPMFDQLMNYNLPGVGPAEVMIYILCDKAKLGGGGSAAKDIIIGKTGYEVKASGITGKFATGFRLGGTIDQTTIMNDAKKIHKDAKVKGKPTEINKGDIKTIKLLHATEWKNRVEIPFAKAATGYFNYNPLILVLQKAAKGRKAGDILHFGAVEQKNVELDVITQGKGKPKIRITQ